MYYNKILHNEFGLWKKNHGTRLKHMLRSFIANNKCNEIVFYIECVDKFL